MAETKKIHLVILIVIIFLLINFMNGTYHEIAESKVVKKIKENYVVKLFTRKTPLDDPIYTLERYGMPELPCSNYNEIRQSNGLSATSCGSYTTQSYVSGD